MTAPGQAQPYFPAWRIFVFGEEITDDVLSCTVNHTDGMAPSTAQIVLANAGTSERQSGTRVAAGQDRYIITEHDIAALYGIVNLNDLDLPERKTTSPSGLREVGAAALASATAGPVTAVAGSISAPITGGEQELAAEERARELEERTRETLAKARDEFEARTAQVANHVDAIIQQRLHTEVDDPVKRGVLLDKFKHVQQVEQVPFDRLGHDVKVLSTRELRALRGEAHRYPFQVGDCIFHSNDPVRIFWRDPKNPEHWYHMFAGFVSDWTDDVTEDNEKTVTLRCEDVSRILRYARFTTNPGIFDIEARLQVQDTEIRTFFSKGFANLSVSELVFALVFGTDKLGGDIERRVTGSGEALPPPRTFKYTRVGRDGDTSTTKVSETGAGSFTFDRSVIGLLPIDGQNPEGSFSSELQKRTVELSLPEYMAMVDHRVYVSDIWNMIAPELASQADGIVDRLARDANLKPLISGAPNSNDVIGWLGTKPHLFPVDGGRLLMYVPKSLGVNTNRNILMKDLTTPATVTTWTTRLALIYDLMERVEFSFYASPRGDLLCEMPLYDFEPDDFGTGNVDLKKLRKTLAPIDALTSNVNAPPVVTFALDEARGEYQSQYLIPKTETISWSRTFSDQNMRTAMICWPALAQSFFENRTIQAAGGKPEVTVIDSLIPQFGVRGEQCDPKGLIVNPEAAKLYTAIKLRQTNADARSADVTALPRVGVCFPNRPLEFEDRKYVATTRTVRHTLVWNNDMSTTYSVNYVRGWAGQERADRPGKPLYEPIGGLASNPIDYSVLLAPRKADSSTKKRLQTTEVAIGGELV